MASVTVLFRPFAVLAVALVPALLSTLGCDAPKKADGPTAATQGTSQPGTSTKSAAAAASISSDLKKPAPARIVAIGDLHGDYDAMVRAFRLAGATDERFTWTGGDLTVVQTGDQVDRGDDDRKILDALDRLVGEATKAGGALHVLNGNHELMNVALDFRYVTDPSLSSFDDLVPKGPAVASLEKVPAPARGRAAAFLPGGPYARKLAERPFVLVLGDNVFVHGGILPKHVDYGLDKLQGETRAWLRGEGPAPRAMMSDDAPVWVRAYSAAPGKEECATLSETLGKVGAKRMIMGHTVQRGGITSACDEKAWRVDVGMSKYYQGTVEVLEIRGDAVKILKP